MKMELNYTLNKVVFYDHKLKIKIKVFVGF